jgi:glutamyl-tRNA synthetase
MAAAVKEWTERAQKFTVKDRKALDAPIAELDAHLTLRSYIAGHSLSDADTAVWKAIRENPLAHSFIKQGTFVNVTRWFRFIEETNPSLAPTLPQRPAKEAKGEKNGAKEETASFDIGLQDVQGGVVTRFPPEPSYVSLQQVTVDRY